MHRGVPYCNAVVNALRAHLAEFGIVAPKGLANAAGLITIINDDTDQRLPGLARRMLAALSEQLTSLENVIAAIEERILAWHKETAESRRLATIPGIGPIIATALAASLPDPSVFNSGREFAAWLGLVPRQNSTGGKERLGRISKQGDRYLRRLLVNGASSVLRRKRGTADPWLVALRRRKPPLVVAVALANKLARIAWAVMRRGEAFHPRRQMMVAP
jgi:transposase